MILCPTDRTELIVCVGETTTHMNRGGVYQFPGRRGSEEGPSSPSLCGNSQESLTSWASQSCLPECVDRDHFPTPPHHLSSEMKNKHRHGPTLTSKKGRNNSHTIVIYDITLH